MHVLFFMLFMISIILVYLLFKDKNVAYTVFFSFLILEIVLKPSICIDGAIIGAKLFMLKVFPSLFPFLVITNIIVACNGVDLYSKLFGKLICTPLRLPPSCSLAVIISMLCGYPLGAKHASDLYRNGTIDKHTYERLLNIATNASPLFIIGAVGTSMLKNPYLGYVLLLTNMLSCLVMSLIIPPGTPSMMKASTVKKTAPGKNFGSLFKKSIDDSLSTVAAVFGFVVIFSVAVSILQSSAVVAIMINHTSSMFGIPRDLLTGLAFGAIEMTNGCAIASTSSLSVSSKVALISFLISFSGFSIISQVHSVVYDTKNSMKKYVLFKFIQGLASYVVSMALLSLIPFEISTAAFSTSRKSTFDILFLLPYVVFALPFVWNKTKRDHLL